MRLWLDDFTAGQRRTIGKLDDRSEPMPAVLSPLHETNLIVLAQFGIACPKERRLTAFGQQLVDEGAAG